MFREINGAFGDVQVVATHKHVLLDVQGEHYASDGHVVRDHGMLSLGIRDAMRVRDLLDKAIADAEGAAPARCDWSDASGLGLGLDDGITKRRYVHERKRPHCAGRRAIARLPDAVAAAVLSEAEG